MKTRELTPVKVLENRQENEWGGLKKDELEVHLLYFSFPLRFKPDSSPIIPEGSTSFSSEGPLTQSLLGVSLVQSSQHP